MHFSDFLIVFVIVNIWYLMNNYKQQIHEPYLYNPVDR